MAHTRRSFLRTLAAACVTDGAASAASPGGGKTLEGVFPIAFSPFTEENKLDLEGLASEVRFCNRGGVAGLIWPQIASAWSTLSDTEVQVLRLASSLMERLAGTALPSGEEHRDRAAPALFRAAADMRSAV